MTTPRRPLNRRQFLGHAACAGIGLTGILSQLGTLRLLGATLSGQGLPQGADDYKALICVFLFGGNDGNNTIIPYDQPTYDRYALNRGALALPRATILPINVANAGPGLQYGLHPSLVRLQPHFNSGRVAGLLNVGTLLAPITKAEYLSGGAAVPPYLFSHNDQQWQWQTSVPDSPKRIGWGGRLADLQNALYNGGSQISMNMSIAGQNFFQAGNDVLQYHLTPAGSVGLNEYNATYSPNPELYRALRDTEGLSYSHIFEREYAGVMNRAISNDTLVRSLLATIPSYTEKFANSVNPNGTPSAIGGQLRMALRMIAGRQTLGHRRQIFFCSMGGFDTHDDQLDNHAALLKLLGDALSDFYQATVDLGVAADVTTFTASDFNRTYSSNGRGSDHAWGSHQLVVGGSVQGGRLYGSMPRFEIDGPDDTGGRGNWIPTISTDEYASTLSKWFGVSAGDMPIVLPNIGRFAHPDLGFMAPA